MTPKHCRAHEIAEAIELVQRIRALGHSQRVPRGNRERMQIVVRAADGRGTNKHITRLIGGLVPAVVRGKPPTRCRSSGRGFG